MSIAPTFFELTADVLKFFFIKFPASLDADRCGAG